jgi:hypothetical protein
MNALRRARAACRASVLCSAIFVTIEIAIGAHAYALVQSALLVAGIALHVVLSRSIANVRTSLPPPAPDATRLTTRR